LFKEETKSEFIFLEEVFKLFTFSLIVISCPYNEPVEVPNRARLLVNRSGRNLFKTSISGLSLNKVKIFSRNS
jgi:hypothetical protein